MWLRELKIRNFRKIEDITINFPRGLCVIVGENNARKTAIIDALRLMLLPSRDFDALRLNEDDFRSGTDYTPIEVSCTFTGLKDEDEVHFQECLVDVGDGKFGDIGMHEGFIILTINGKKVVTPDDVRRYSGNEKELRAIGGMQSDGTILNYQFGN